MLANLVLLFTVVPLVELALLVWIGGQTAWWVPIVFVLVTGMAGAALVRWQGWRIVSRIQTDLRAGRMPADAMVDGLLIVVAGVLLVTPGVLTDLAAVVLLVPLTRRLVKRQVAAWLQRQIRIQTASFRASHGIMPDDDEFVATPDGDKIIDAEVVETTIEEAK
jgi:UPF0716 protein FxsA